jgi:hypothetical protein
MRKADLAAKLEALRQSLDDQLGEQQELTAELARRLEHSEQRTHELQAVSNSDSPPSRALARANSRHSSRRENENRNNCSSSKTRSRPTGGSSTDSTPPSTTTEPESSSALRSDRTPPDRTDSGGRTEALTR